ncbi:MAG: alanyl-tRNA editing protein [Anaerolineales bacterium]|jgi:misacylated tRNA(Ala) deacylase|nr:alanyl-tRNA editing protein [Anaerolineales bacterium]
MTVLLFYEDSYLKTFTARVTDVSKHGISLDRTAFYPGGGGQPCDLGAFQLGNQTLPMKRVHKVDGEIWHEIDGDPPTAGADLEGELDWERRYQLMRVHTAMHILCGVIWRDYGASVTGGNMQPLHGRMDFEFESMHKELVVEIEEKINLEVNAARSVKTAILPRAEAFQIPDLIRTKINLLPPAIQEVRVVEIEGLDLQADGGTHVANTEEVSQIRIVDYKSKGAINKRLVIELEP